MTDSGSLASTGPNLDASIHATLIHTSSKLFWRTHATFAIHIFEHEHSDVLEVITYNTGTDEPAKTIFLSLKAIMPMVQEEIMYKYNTKLHQLENIREKSRTGHATPKNQFDQANAIIHRDLALGCVSEYIVHHMTTVKESNSDTLIVKFQPVVGDGEQAVRALSELEAPPMPSDASYQRQIKPSVEEVHEFEKIVSHVATETSQISKLSDSAAQMEIAARKSVNRKRWRFAIKKVIQHIAEEKKPPKRVKVPRAKRVQAPSVYPGSTPTDGFKPLQNYVEPKPGQLHHKNDFLHSKASAVRMQTCVPVEVNMGRVPTPPVDEPPTEKKIVPKPLEATNNLLRHTIGHSAKRKETVVLPSITSKDKVEHSRQNHSATSVHEKE